MKILFRNIYNLINLINQKYKDLFKTKLKHLLQFFPSNIYILLFFILITIIIAPKLLNNITNIYSTGYGAVVPEEIVKESVVQDIYIKDISKIDNLSIKFSTYNRKNNSTYKVIVYENDNIIYTKKVDASKLTDNKYESFKINHKVKKDNKYKFEVKPIKVKKGNGITITQDTDGNYAYKLCKKSIFYNECIIISIVLLIIFFVINYLINNEKIKSEEKFYKIMIVYFVIITLVFPPLFEPDSEYHFKRAYTISQKNVYEFIVNNTFTIGKKPSNIKCLEYGNTKTAINEVTSKEDIIECFDSKKMVKQKGKLDIGNKIAFAFSGLGIKITNLFTNSPMIFFYIGRLCNTIISFLIILFALRTAPKHKRIILSVVMIPVFLQQMCSYSYDSILNSLCVLVIAYLLKFFNDKEKVKNIDLIIYIICTIFILHIKLPYVLVSTPIIFVDKDKFGKTKISKLIYMLGFAIILGLAYIIPKLGGSLSAVDTSGNGERGMSLSSLFDIKHTILIIYATAKEYTNFYLESLIGGLAWLNQTYISKIFIYFYLLLLCLGVISEKQVMNVKKIHKIFIFLICIALIGAIFLAMYLLWTMPTSTVIEGVQGRYLFVPLLGLLLCLIPKNNKINISNETFYSFFNISCVIYIITMLYLFY